MALIGRAHDGGRGIAVEWYSRELVKSTAERSLHDGTAAKPG